MKPDDSTATFASKIRLGLSQLPYLPKTFRLVWSAAKTWTIAWAAIMIIQGLLPASIALLARRFVNSLVLLLKTGGRNDMGPLLVAGGAIGLVLLLSEGLSNVESWVRTAQAEYIQDHILELIHAQTVRLDLGFFESSEYYDQLHRAHVDALSRPAALLENAGSLIKNGLAMAALACIMATYAWWLPPALLAGALPVLFIAGRFTWRFHEWRKRNTMNERRVRYLDGMLTWHQSAAELRQFDLGGHFRDAFRTLRQKLRRERLDLAGRQMAAELAAGLSGLLVMGLIMVWMIGRIVRGISGLGDAALFYQVLNQGQRLMRSLLSNFSESYRNIFFLENLFEFLALQPAVRDPASPVACPAAVGKDLRLEGVTFRYPGNTLAALQDFHLTLPAGKITALVGENGAGKSTVIKLLCRLYDPEAGRILVDGTDVRAFALADWRRRITVLFQEPVHYHETAADNILFGDLADNPGVEEMEAAARAGGADTVIERLPKGYDTVLGKWFGGSELSVGEWQRVSLARAFLRRASFVILDEPTGAMDSWAEADWMSRFQSLVAGRTALIVTHRFTTALKADVIHVMSRGNVIESGTHKELLALDGAYARAWRSQVEEEAISNPLPAKGRGE